ncbi:MAG: Crp/Fnr family transcriptional regulator [Flavobacteriaceae bacterium]|nr:Crp/Fnr family transcriptional regulator [Flavobacteriaceae bacterium]
MKRIEVKKGEVLQAKGELNTKVFKVASGLLRSYSIDEKGKEHIFMFAPEAWIMADAVAHDAPASLYIDALEDSVLVQTTKNPELMHDADRMLKRMKVLQDRVIMLMSASALDRYEHFLETYPDIVQRVPQKMIASYLGITPEALSKVKKDYFHKAQ